MPDLPTELHRLYQLSPAPAPLPQGLFDDAGRTRLAVLSMADPAEEGRVGAVWAGVQSVLGLPAPALAVDGHGALQLWFAFEAAQAPATAQAFLQRVVQVCGLAVGERAPGPPVTLWPMPGDPPRHAAPVPAQVSADGRWSAFVAPDLAPLFLATPWLDGPPGDAAQARILASLVCIGPQAVEAVLARGAPEVAPSASPPAALPATEAREPTPPASTHALPSRGLTPEAFLRTVMDDEHTPLALRLQAAIALLGRRSGDTG